MYIIMQSNSFSLGSGGKRSSVDGNSTSGIGKKARVENITLRFLLQSKVSLVLKIN